MRYDNYLSDVLGGKMGYAIQPAEDFSIAAHGRSMRDDDDLELEQLLDGGQKPTGIVAVHLAPLQRLARQERCIIGVRPVEEHATSLIVAGHPTKGFHVKGKSANWGPQAGFICEDQALSKLENEDADRIAKFNKQTAECIRDGYAQAVPLVVSSTRLNELSEKNYIKYETEPNGNLKINALAPSGRTYVFTATRELSGDPLAHEEQVHYRVTSSDRKDIWLLAPKGNPRPFTADYDLLVVAPHMSQLGPMDRLPVPDVAHQVFKSRLTRYKGDSWRNTALASAYDDLSAFYDKEDKDIGNASERIRAMIVRINGALVGTGERVVHHNADSGSPATDEAANYPATFVLPSRLGAFGAVCVIKDQAELVQLFQAAKDNGYHVPINPLWSSKLRDIKRASFTASRAAVAARLGNRGKHPDNPY